VPVTARLSKAFYDRFGEDVVAELVEWLNMVDATYRNELKEVNELNFARFDAKLEQRLAQFEAKFETRLEIGLANLRSVLHRSHKDHMRFLYLSLVAQVTLILMLWGR
jgi:hypothetical protein